MQQSHMTTVDLSSTIDEHEMHNDNDLFNDEFLAAQGL